MQVNTRRTKIIATVGPASRDEQTLFRLVQAGVDVFRLNFSHGDHTEYHQIIQRIRKISADVGRPIAILQDLQGPKIRIGEIANGSIELSTGQPLTLTTRPLIGDAHTVSVDYTQLTTIAVPGNRILLDDGNLELEVTKVTADAVETRVALGGVLKSHKGVNLPGAWINLPALTEKDEIDLAFGLGEGVDAVAISFVRQAQDIHLLREQIQAHGAGASPPADHRQA